MQSKSDKQGKYYFWVKIGQSFFETNIVKRITNQKNNMLWLYLYMLTMACKFEGELRDNEKKPLTIEDIEILLPIPEEEAREAVAYFLKIGAMEKDEDLYLLPQAVLLTGQEGEGAERQRRFRERHPDGKAHKAEPIQEPEAAPEQMIEPEPEAIPAPAPSPEPAPVETQEAKVVVLPSAKKNKRKEEEASDNDKIIEETIDYLNKRIHTSYRPSSAETKKHLHARIKEGYKLEDFIRVIDSKAKEWLDDPKMRQYLRPSTLFSSKNFESYLQSAIDANAWTDRGQEIDYNNLQDALLQGLIGGNNA